MCQQTFPQFNSVEIGQLFLFYMENKFILVLICDGSPLN